MLMSLFFVLSGSPAFVASMWRKHSQDGENNIMSSSIPLTEEDLHDLYVWVDEIPLSKPKRNIARDFSDGVCVAEILKHYFPKLVEIHNFPATNSSKQKISNWETINGRILRKLHFEVPAVEIQDIVAAVPGAIERFLRALRTKITQIKNIQEQKMLTRDDNNDDEAGLYGGHHHAAAVYRPPSSSTVVTARPHVAAPLPTSAGATNRAALSSASSGRGGPIRPPPVARSDNNDYNNDIPSSTQGLRKLLEEKDLTILELRESIALLTDKVGRMEDLMRVKDEKIARYKQQLGR